MEEVYHTLTEIVSSAADEKFLSQLTSFGINPSKVYKNLSSNDMVNLIVERKEGG